jgi:hypothetical protein
VEKREKKAESHISFLYVVFVSWDAASSPFPHRSSNSSVFGDEGECVKRITRLGTEARNMSIFPRVLFYYRWDVTLIPFPHRTKCVKFLEARIEL